MVKVVFENPWYQRSIFYQPELLKGKGVYIKEEPSTMASKIGFEARQAQRKGLLQKCKTLTNSVVLTSNTNDTIETITTLDE